MNFERVILVVLDSVGVGAARDAQRFGDENSNTLKHVADWCAKSFPAFRLPQLSRWGLDHIVQAYGIEKNARPIASTAILEELSPGKDTTTGHWEIAGNVLTQEFPTFPQGFSAEFMDPWLKENNLPGFLCNRPASGTTVLDDFGEEHLRSGKPIVYTSADSVFQVACSEESFGLQRLYDICVSARRILDPLGVGRIIARPFVGKKRGAFQRTENRKDYSVPPPQPNLLDILREQSFFVAGVGKIEDIFAHRSVNLVDHTGRNETSLAATLKMMEKTRGQRGLIFTNLIDFDMLHGHRRNPQSYAQALMDFDAFLPQLEKACGPNDLLLLTADHGNDPTHPGSDHTRENVPFLFWSPRAGFRPRHWGTVRGFASIARLTLEALGLSPELAKLSSAQNAPSLWDTGSPT